MSEIQEIISGFAEALENGTLGGCDLRLLIRALDGVPDCFHSQIIKAAFGIVKPETQDAPEDYLAVKTFDSREFHVGDEIIGNQSGKKYVVSKVGLCALYVLGENAEPYTVDVRQATRTGRNFPAIAAIMEEIRK